MYIENNPIDCIIEIFEKTYPGTYITSIQFDVIPEEEGYGYTHFTNDGDVVIGISVDLPIGDVAEILSHELAHVVDVHKNGLPPAGEEHRQSWDEIFTNIAALYEDNIEEFVKSRSK